MINLKLRHLIGAVAAAAFFAVVFGTLGLLVVAEIQRCREWEKIKTSILRGVPAYLGDMP